MNSQGAPSRRALSIANWDGALATASEQAAASYVSLYALALGASKSQIGLLTALPALLGNVLQLPAATLADRVGHRKRICLIGGLGARALWLPIAALSFWLAGQTAFYAFLALLATRAIFASLAAPAWTALMADLTPHRIRGIYFSNRSIACSLAGLVATLGAGWLVGALGPGAGYPAVFATAFVLGVAATAIFARMPVVAQPPPAHHARHHLSLGQRIALIGRALKREPNFTGFCISSLLWNFAVTMPGPLFAVYFVNQLGGQEQAWGIVTGASLVSTILGQRYWGRLTDRFGRKNVMVVSGVLCALIPFAWIVIPSAGWANLVNFYAGFFWAGYNLAAFNLLLEATPDERRATYVAGYNALVGLSGSAGPLLGGFLADWLSIPAVFLISGVLRLAGWLLFQRLVKTREPRPLVLRDLLPRLPRRAGSARLALPGRRRLNRRENRAAPGTASSRRPSRSRTRS